MMEKRQEAAAVQKLALYAQRPQIREAFWSAAARCRFANQLDELRDFTILAD